MSLEGMIDKMMTIITANTERTLRLGQAMCNGFTESLI